MTETFNKFINTDIYNGILYMKTGISNVIEDVINNNNIYEFSNIPYSIIEECTEIKGYVIRTDLELTGKYTSIIKDKLNNELIKVEGNLINGRAKFRSLIS